MPPVSQAQRSLMEAAASDPNGAGGVPQDVGQEFADADQGGKLPKHKPAKKKSRSDRLYGKKKGVGHGRE